MANRKWTSNPSHSPILVPLSKPYLNGESTPWRHSGWPHWCKYKILQIWPRSKTIPIPHLYGNLPISKTDGIFDRILWKHSSSGEYKVSAAYSLLHQNHNSTHLLNQRISNIPQVVWKLIWKVKLPLKIITFIWKILYDNIPIFVILNRRGISATNKCLMCNEEEETITHLFLHCPFARVVWHGFILEIRTSDLNQISAKQWIVDCIIANKFMEQNKMSFLQSLFTIFWSMWNHRNLVLHQGNYLTLWKSSSPLKLSFAGTKKPPKKIKSRITTLDINHHNFLLTMTGKFLSSWQLTRIEDPKEVAMHIKL